MGLSRRVVRIVLVGVGAACLSGCVTQQDRAYGIRTLKFTKFGGHADFIARRQEREIKSKTTESETRSKETIFEESLTLETEGFVFHPNVVELALGGTFGLLQETFEDEVNGRKRKDSRRGNLSEFDLDARILKRTAYPTTVFAHRRRGLVARPFLPSLETTTTSYGVTWQYVSEKTPTSFRFNHTDALLSPLFITGATEQDGRQRSTEFSLRSDYHRTDHDTLTFLYEHTSVQEEPFELDYDADELTLTHDLELGSQRQHRLRSELNYLDQRGTIALERRRWREDLRLELTDSLESRIRFEALDRSRGSRSRAVPETEERSFHLSGSLRHQLFLSQTVQVQAFVQDQEFQPELDITRWGGQFNFNYRKTNRWGVLRANYRARYERMDRRGATRTAETVDEVHTFRDPDPITLGSPNVITSSITVRAEDRVTFYQLGRDFRRRVIGTIVEIERIPTGRIADGQTVLVDYLFDVGGMFELDTVGQTFDIRQDFDFGLTPYYRLDWQDQTLTPEDTATAIAEDITAHVVGVEYEKSSLRLFAEYEDRDSTINPFTSTRLGASYTHRFAFGAESSVHARWTDTNFFPPNARAVELLTLETRHRLPIAPNLTFEGSLLYRNGEDTFSGDADGTDLSLSLEWLIRKMTIRMSFEHSEYEDIFVRNRSSAFFVHLRRDI